MNERLKSRIITFLLGALAVVSSGIAQASEHSRTSANDLVKALMERFNVSEDEVYKHLDSQGLALKQNSQILALRSEAYAGSWYDFESKKLVVGVAGSDRQLISAVEGLGAKAISLDFSLQELIDLRDAALSSIDSGSAGDGVMGASLDIQGNSVAIQVIADAYSEVSSSVVSLGVPRLSSGRSAVSVEVVPGPAEAFAPLYNAGAFNSYETSGSLFNQCSVGFGVTIGSSEGFLTAAHCGFTGHTVRTPAQTSIGTITGSTFSNSMPPCIGEPLIGGDACGTLDQAIATITNSGFNATYQITPTSPQVFVKSAPTPLVGMWVCRYGRSTTGPHCGTVEALNDLIYLSTNRRIPVTPLIRASACATFGDSGGPLVFVDGNKALPQRVHAIGTLTGRTPTGGVGCPSAGGPPSTVYSDVQSSLSRFGASLIVYPY